MTRILLSGVAAVTLLGAVAQAAERHECVPGGNCSIGQTGGVSYGTVVTSDAPPNVPVRRSPETAAPKPDPRDAQIKELKAELTDAATLISLLEAQRDQALKAAQDAELQRTLSYVRAQHARPQAPAPGKP